MSAPQKLSEDQREEVSRILRKKIIASGLIFFAVLAGVTGYSLWDVYSRLKNHLESLVAKQFEEPRIQAVVSNVAQTKAKELLIQQINPEIERFKNQITSQLSNLKTLETQSDAHAKEIGKILFALKQTQKELKEVKEIFDYTYRVDSYMKSLLPEKADEVSIILPKVEDLHSLGDLYITADDKQERDKLYEKLREGYVGTSTAIGDVFSPLISSKLSTVTLDSITATATAPSVEVSLEDDTQQQISIPE